MKAIQVKCPTCGAPPQVQCKGTTGQPMGDTYHQSRKRKATRRTL